MNLITIIIIAIVIWLVYSLIQSYRNLEKELREIRAKCIGVNNTASSEENKSTTTTDTSKTATFITSKKDIYVPPGKLTPSSRVDSPIKTRNNTNTRDNSATPDKNTTNEESSSTQTGAYTPTGDQVYSTDSDPYDNDPLSSMKKNLLYGLKSLKTYSEI